MGGLNRGLLYCSISVCGSNSYSDSHSRATVLIWIAKNAMLILCQVTRQHRQSDDPTDAQVILDASQ